jgi:hypothetical protein
MEKIDDLLYRPTFNDSFDIEDQLDDFTEDYYDPFERSIKDY